MFQIQTKNRKFLPFDNEDEKKWSNNFFFVQCADTQFGMEVKWRDKNAKPSSEPEIEWSTQLVQDIHSMTPRPKFLVICGDLLDAFPVAEAELREKQRKEFIEVFKVLDIPLVCICGNHDVGNQPTYESISNYRSSFGDDYFSFWCAGVFFISLNSQVYEDSSLIPKIAEEQEQWLETQIKEAKDAKHIVVFQHIPYFIADPQEDKNYFNIAQPLRETLLQRLYEAGIRYVFAGHYHRNAGGFYKDMEVVVTSAVGTQLGKDKNGYRIVKVYASKIEHNYYDLGCFPKTTEF